MMLWCVTISLESCIITYFDIAVSWIRMGMKRNGLRYIMLSKIAVLGSAGRGNRFPVGRNRVPLCEFIKTGKNARRNRFLYR